MLQKYSRAFPDAWRQIARMRNDRGKALPWWPDWCFAPIAASIAIITNGAPVFGHSEFAMMQQYPPAAMAALAAWRITKGIYRFDETLFGEIVEMPLDGDLPAEIFYSLPEWCIYVETPGMSLQLLDNKPVSGFFAHLEYDPKDSRHELRLTFLLPEEQVFPVALHLGKWTVEEAVCRMFEESRVQSFLPSLTEEELQEAIKEMSSSVVPFLNLVLYICSVNADFGGNRPVHPSRRPAGKKGKIIAADSIRTWDVGVRVGPALRKAVTAKQHVPSADGKESIKRTHASPRPHYRRAHWHHFWTGPRSKPAERKLILKWLPPIPVGIPEFDEAPVVIHPVKEN